MRRTDEAPLRPGQVEEPRRDRNPGTLDIAEARDLRGDLAPGPSKTRRKAEMRALQDLGESLVEQSPSRLALLCLPERLADAIAEARSMTRWEARRRQMQFIGRLMRDVDVEPIRARLSEWSSAPIAEKARISAVERWRERLLNDRDALGCLCAEVPDTDRDRLSALVARAQKERMSNQPPHAYRELFRVLNTLLRTSGRD